MKNSYKYLFFISLILGSLISISANSWFSVWMGLEINLLSFIPLMMTSKNLFSSESSLKYFLIQALGSSFLLFSVFIFMIFLNFKMNNSEIFLCLISSTLLLKSGSAPFHFWFPSVMEGLTWFSNILIMTWQKLAPLMILSYSLSFNLLIMAILLSMIFSGVGGLNQTSLRKLMAFSSINHLGWMLASMLFSENLWFTYFLFYSFLSLSIIFIFINFNLYNINQTFKMSPFNLFLKISFFINLLSLGGLPPFIGFFPKWIIIEMLTSLKMFSIIIFMVFFTLIVLYFYLRISYSALLMNHIIMSWNFNENLNKNYTKMLYILSFIMTFGLLIINFFYFFM